MLLGTETKRASLPGSGQDEMADDVRGLDGFGVRVQDLVWRSGLVRGTQSACKWPG